MADQAHPRAASSTAVPPLVGRERELGVLHEALGAALAGRGGLVLIGGEAGIGKTALAEAALAEAADQGALVLIGRCYDLAETPPYGPWAEALERAPLDMGLPDLPAVLLPPERGGDAVTSQGAILPGARAYLAALAAHRPLVLLLEDLRWADLASLDLLRFVARGLAELPLLILATYRADEVADEHPLAALVPTLMREARAERLDLRPLDEAAIDTLVAGRYPLLHTDRGRLVRYLAARTGGNALFLAEVLRTLESEGVLRRESGGWAVGDLAAVPVPVLLRRVLGGRVARLGPETRRLLTVAATIGQVVPLATWAAVGEVAEDDLLDHAARASDARLVAIGTEDVRFAHALIREVLYAGAPPARRRKLHRRIADYLLAQARPDPDAVAYHLRQAGDPRAAEWLTIAGARAERAYAWLTAAERYEAALALLDAAGGMPGERAVLLATIAQLRRYADVQRAIGQMGEAARLAAEVGDRALAASCRFDQGHLRCLAHDLSPGLAQMEAALPALEALPEAERQRLPTLRILRVTPGERHHRGALVIQLAGAGRLAEARSHGAGMLARLPGTTGRGLLGLGLMHALLGQPTLARRAYADARARFRAAGEHVEVHRTFGYEITSVAWPYYADQPAAWRALVAEAEQVMARAVEAQPTLVPRGVARAFLLLCGAWGEPHLLYGWVRGTLARYQGDSALAWAQIERALPWGATTEPGAVDLVDALALQRLASALALDAGNLPTGRAWLECHDRWRAWSGAVLGRSEGALSWAHFHRAAGDLAAAREAARRALDHAADPRQPLVLLAALRLLGELATTAGCYAEAGTHLEESLALADACEAPYERALTLLALAELRHSEGRCEEAGMPLAEARAICAPLDARPTLARIAAFAAQPAAPPPASPRPDGLSRREAEVLGLLAAGRSNHQIAQALCLSPRTVQRHVANAYLKIGAHNKAEATAYALRHGLA